MRLGQIVAMPNEYSRYARVLDGSGLGYTVEPGDLPEDVEAGDEVAYRVELWGNESGLAYDLEED